jgi:hypothetical protein
MYMGEGLKNVDPAEGKRPREKYASMLGEVEEAKRLKSRENLYCRKTKVKEQHRPNYCS